MRRRAGDVSGAWSGLECQGEAYAVAYVWKVIGRLSDSCERRGSEENDRHQESPGKERATKILERKDYRVQA